MNPMLESDIYLANETESSLDDSEVRYAGFECIRAVVPVFSETGTPPRAAAAGDPGTFRNRQVAFGPY